jgi:hypothetical protein
VKKLNLSVHSNMLFSEPSYYYVAQHDLREIVQVTVFYSFTQTTLL